mmetsp:Transcript_69782/g.196753  ORF Transcript_69782/g.196753 Transcript_69782/m.196753 type:complete len:219 (-) Transcript_69782:157-813(-)
MSAAPRRSLAASRCSTRSRVGRPWGPREIRRIPPSPPRRTPRRHAREASKCLPGCRGAKSGLPLAVQAQSCGQPATRSFRLCSRRQTIRQRRRLASAAPLVKSCCPTRQPCGRRSLFQSMHARALGTPAARGTASFRRRAPLLRQAARPWRWATEPGAPGGPPSAVAGLRQNPSSSAPARRATSTSPGPRPPRPPRPPRRRRRQRPRRRRPRHRWQRR